MIETRIETMFRSAESIGGGVTPEEVVKLQRRVKEAKTKPRYCENPDCRVLKLTGEPQRLRGLSGMIVEKGARRGMERSRVCSWCSGVDLEEEEQEEKKAEFCKYGHDIAEVRRGSNNECRQCKREQNAAAARKRREELLHKEPPPGCVILRNLSALKERWGGDYKQLAAESGCSYGSIKHWAYLTRSAPLEGAEKLAEALGCTVDELTDD